MASPGSRDLGVAGGVFVFNFLRLRWAAGQSSLVTSVFLAPGTFLYLLKF